LTPISDQDIPTKHSPFHKGNKAKRGQAKGKMETEGPFSINVSQSEGLPPTEIYLLAGEDQQNESSLEAETPAHGNLSTKGGADEATTLKHPRAPKNKRHSEPKKFTFDGLTPDNSLIESRDEDDPIPLVKEFVHQKADKNGDDNRDTQTSNLGKEAAAMVETPEEIEHEGGAYWFTDCGVPKINDHTSFPTAPFDEDPDPSAVAFNLFCNRPPPTLTPHAVVATDYSPMEDQLEPIKENECQVDTKMNTEDEGDSPAVSPVQNKKTKVVPLTLSPSTAAVMNTSDVSCFQGDLEMAPSDELENRCTFEEGVVADDDDHEKFNDKLPIEENEQMKTLETEISVDGGESGESNELMDETENGVSQGDSMTSLEGNATKRSAHDSSDEEDLKGIHVLTNEDKEHQMIKVPSVVSPSGDSDEQVALQATAAVSMGDLRQQFDHMRVSDALQAVSQSFIDQPFMGTDPFLGAEFCGQHIMDWFGNNK